MKPSPTEIQRRRHRDLERCRDQRASLTAQRDALLLAAEAAERALTNHWDNNPAQRGLFTPELLKLRAAVQQAKGGAE